MRKKILFMLSAFCFMGATVFGQAIEGGAGIIHVTGDPNENLSLNTVTVNEGNIAYDADNQVAYFYDPAGSDFVALPTPGTHWIAVDIAGLVDPITSIVVDAAGSPELTASTTAGVTTLSFESDATISYVPATNIFTFTDLDGDATTVDLSELDDIVQAETGNASITVTGDGSVGTPYEISLTGADVIGNAGMVPVTDGAGTLTWTNVVENVTVSTDGQVMLTFTDSATPVAIDMSNIPEAANITELNGFAGALGAGETGLVRAANNNTFGMPATSAVGVLFFISN